MRVLWVLTSDKSTCRAAPMHKLTPRRGRNGILGEVMGLPFHPNHFSHCCDSPYSDTIILFPLPVQAGCPDRVIGVLMILGSPWLCIALKEGCVCISSTHLGNPLPFVCPTFHLSRSHLHPSAVPYAILYLHSAFCPGSSSTCVAFCICFGISASTSTLTPTFCPCFIFLILFLEPILSLSYVFPFSSLWFQELFSKQHPSPILTHCPLTVERFHHKSDAKISRFRVRGRLG